MTTQRRALVIGGSMSGLLAAIMLRRRGWAVDVFERVESELDGRGAGIVAQAELIARLDALGLDTRDLGVPARTAKAPRHRRPHRADRRMSPGADRLGARLPRPARCVCARALSSRPRRCRRLRKTKRASLAQFADGATAEGDVLIGADGLRSTVRGQCLPDAVPLYAGYCAWRALLPESAIPPAIHRELFEVDDVLPAARRAMPVLSGGRAERRSARRDTAAATSSGIGPRTKRANCRGFSPTTVASRIRSRFRRRSSAAKRSPRCARRPSGCCRRSFAPSFG